MGHNPENVDVEQETARAKNYHNWCTTGTMTRVPNPDPYWIFIQGVAGSGSGL